MIRLEWADPIGGASPLTPTDMASPPPDATELERAYSERFAAQVQDWWLPLRTSGAAARQADAASTDPHQELGTGAAIQ